MKKFLLMSTLCALALVGCKDDSEPEIPTDIDYSGLVLNEICGNDGNASEEDWIEIYNTSNTTINLNGVKLVKTDEEGVSEIIYTFGEGAAIAGKAYLLKVKGVDFTQGISNTKSVSITLIRMRNLVMEVNMKWEAVIHVFLTVRENGLLY